MNVTTTSVRRSLRRISAVLGVAVALTACSDSTKVGEGLEAGKGSDATGCRLGECTTTTAAVTSSTQATTTTARPTSTTKPPVATTQPRQAVFVIKVQSDNASGGQFSPRVASVRKGTTVRWTNTDTIPRSVEADEGRFKSPSIPPGGSFDYVADTPGSFNYHDGTRPYAVGTLQVA